MIKSIVSGLFVAVVAGVIVWWITQEPPPPPPPPPEPEPRVTCQTTLVGGSGAECVLDVDGPQLLTITVTPKPQRAQWSLSVSGLIRLASSCEFVGDFDAPRPTSFKARGKATVTCPIGSKVSESGHAISYQLNTKRIEPGGQDLHEAELTKSSKEGGSHLGSTTETV